MKTYNKSLVFWEIPIEQEAFTESNSKVIQSLN